VPAQTWPLAVWPDGSVKWLGVAVSGGPELVGPFQLGKGAAALPTMPLKATQDAGGVSIDTGVLQCRVAAGGDRFIESMTIDGRVVARDGQLVAMTEDRTNRAATGVVREERFVSEVGRVTLEQAGPVRAVVKVEGMHRALRGGRDWLPFTVRLYFSAGVEAVRMVHTFVFDGDQEKDFIRGPGVRFTVPMREEVQNHTCVSRAKARDFGRSRSSRGGTTGTVCGQDRRDGHLDADQLAGRRVPNSAEVNARGKGLLEQWAVWDSFRLVQPNADGFTIEKRTNPLSAWIPAGAGGRATGFVFVGDVSGGLAVSLKNFWQSYPAALEVRGAASAAAELTVWLWTPEAPAMDLRHYDIKAHGLEAAYEDVQPGFSIATGVARTSELMLFPSAAVPTKTESAAQAAVGREPRCWCVRRRCCTTRGRLGSGACRTVRRRSRKRSRTGSMKLWLITRRRWSSTGGMGFGTSATSCTATTPTGMCGVMTSAEWPGTIPNSGRICGCGIRFYAPGARIFFGWRKR